MRRKSAETRCYPNAFCGARPWLAATRAWLYLVAACVPVFFVAFLIDRLGFVGPFKIWVQNLFVLGAIWVLTCAVDLGLAGGQPIAWFLGARRAYAWHFGWCRSVRYADIRAVEETDREVVVATDRRRIQVGSATLNSHVLAQALRARADLEPAAEPERDVADVALSPGVVESWLGVDAGGVLTLKAHQASRALKWTARIAAALYFTWAIVVSLWTGAGFVAAILALFALLIFGGDYLIHTHGMAVRELRADGQGFEVNVGRRWRRFAWGAVQDAANVGWGVHRLSTTEGDLMLGPWLAKKRLLATVRQIVAARASGLALPRLTNEPVPAGALSPVDAEEANEAAISRVDAR